MLDLEVLDDESMDHATLKRIRLTASHAALAVRCKLNGKKALVVNLLKVV